MKTLTSRTGMFLLALGIGFAPALTADVFHYAGNIATGDQYDLYPFDLLVGTHVVADLVCDPPPNNTLDTILSAYAPGIDTSSTENATFYDDDGGTMPCGGFESSRLDFHSDFAGVWQLRVDGFGSGIGGYTLDVVTTQDGLVAVPTLDTLGLGLLVLCLAAAALFVMRRQRRA